MDVEKKGNESAITCLNLPLAFQDGIYRLENSIAH